ncbi:hypothetical protein IW261DRAFT_1433418 [Armillaria novae-zelandiae]|uniref:Uncharacterized protein n=1 Tax=Armillaria novae-zelandiae TaxID=153914 RepID=A0AA39PUA6_9AGAR|nr:hypothetical protein IW261DRAFT_1433418 [Armillaria novae-zelandiae]
MFTGFHSMTQTDAELATLSLHEERDYRFTSFSASDAVTLGLSIRKRFRGSSRHVKGKGLVISIQTIAGHTLFSCTVGDLGHPDGVGDVSLDSWACLEGMVNVVRRTGHSSFYVEKSMGAMGKTPTEMGIQGDFRVNGGAFPIWLQVKSSSIQVRLTWTSLQECTLLSHWRSRLLLWFFTRRPYIGRAHCPRLSGQAR